MAAEHHPAPYNPSSISFQCPPKCSLFFWSSVAPSLFTAVTSVRSQTKFFNHVRPLVSELISLLFSKRRSPQKRRQCIGLFRQALWTQSIQRARTCQVNLPYTTCYREHDLLLHWTSMQHVTVMFQEVRNWARVETCCGERRIYCQLGWLPSPYRWNPYSFIKVFGPGLLQCLTCVIFHYSTSSISILW